MNALPLWDAEQRLAAAPVPDARTPAAISTENDARTTEAMTTEHEPPAEPLPGAHRVTALASALEALDPGTDLRVAIQHLLAAIDAADAEAGIARVDTNDAVLQQRIARIVSGANLPSRGPVTRARDILSMLITHHAA